MSRSASRSSSESGRKSGSGAGATRPRREVVAPGRLDRRDRRPAHAEVALDGAGHRGGRDHLAGQARCPPGRARRRCARRWSRRRRRRRPRRRPRGCVVEAAGEQLDAGQHDVGRGAADHLGEGPAAGVGAAAEVLAADDVAEEDLADRAPGAVGREHADPRARRCRPGRTASATPRRAAATTRLRLDVAGDHHRPRPAASAARKSASPSSTSALPPSVPPTSSTTSGSAVRRSAQLGVVEAAREHQHDLAAAGEGDPAAGLGGDQLLVADDGDAQAAAGARAGEHVGVEGARVLLGERGQAGVVPVEHVADALGVGERGRVAGGAEEVTGVEVDQRGLGEGRPEVDADDDAPPRSPLTPGLGRGRRRRSSTVSMPTLSRIRSSGTSRSVPATLACVILPGCSISDSTPPSDSPSVKTSARSQTASACSTPPATRKEIIPPKRFIWRAATSWPGWAARPG